MNSVFPVDEIGDSYWQPPPPPSSAADPAPGAMGRSQSEWALESFLAQVTCSGSISPSASSIAPPPTPGRPGEGGVLEDVVEIKKPNGQLAQLNQPQPPPPPQPQPQLQPQPKVPVNPDDSHAFLKSRLEMACAAVARFNEGTMKPGEPIGYPKMPLQASISTQSDFQADGSGHGVPIPQGADSGSLGISALPTIQRDSGVHVKQTTSESSREDSDDEEFEGDTGTTENKDPAEVRRARRMQSNRESARRSRRRKQEHMSELENQVGQLKVEHTGLLKRLTDMNQKYDVASVDNRILKADIETLRAKVKMAEETVKRVTGINPLVIAMSNLPSSDIPFGSSPMDSFTTAATPMQPNADHFFHHAAPNITSINPHHPRFDSSGFPRNNPLPVLTNIQADAISNNVAPVSSMQGVPGAPGAIPGWSSNIPPPLANTNIKHK
ncbi:light-inducible protein CPRF2 isoform X1 [Eucalyptus grandis]|uniref:light-inducible protein CPRF2 isoform X1 n=1 Tax=Eucalyptus grandis TaxID=71139 RepID=UPI00192EC434|nr:light-inducible protein CPRF2 isoform X1 [Eucalyptus grandis]